MRRFPLFQLHLIIRAQYDGKTWFRHELNASTERITVKLFLRHYTSQPFSMGWLCEYIHSITNRLDCSVTERRPFRNHNGTACLTRRRALSQPGGSNSVSALAHAIVSRISTGPRLSLCTISPGAIAVVASQPGFRKPVARRGRAIKEGSLDRRGQTGFRSSRAHVRCMISIYERASLEQSRHRDGRQPGHRQGHR